MIIFFRIPAQSYNVGMMLKYPIGHRHKYLYTRHCNFPLVFIFVAGQSPLLLPIHETEAKLGP